MLSGKFSLFSFSNHPYLQACTICDYFSNVVTHTVPGTIHVIKQTHGREHLQKSDTKAYFFPKCTLHGKIYHDLVIHLVMLSTDILTDDLSSLRGRPLSAVLYCKRRQQTYTQNVISLFKQKIFCLYYACLY